MKLRRGPAQFASRKARDIPVGGQGSPFQGLNTTFPHTQLPDGGSPNLYNVRLYARKAEDRRVGVGTRKGPGFYSVPLGETVDQQETSTTGASTQEVTTTTWFADEFTAGATGRLTKVDVKVATGTSPTQHLMVRIYDDSSGAPGTLLATSSILQSNISTADFVSARFIEAPEVTSTNTYWVVVHMQRGGSGTYDISTTTNDNTGLTSADSGGSWSASSDAMNLKTYVSTDSPFLGGKRFVPSTATAKTVIAHGTNVYTVSEIDGSTTSIDSGLNSSATEYNFDQADDKLWFVNGYNGIRYYDNSTVTAVADAQAPTDPKFLAFHKGRLFVAGQSSDPTRLGWSDFADYDSWVSTGFVNVPQPKTGDPITGLKVFQDNLVIFTRNTKYILYGEDPGNFVLRQASGKRGAVNQAVIQADPNYIYFLSDDGVYRFNGSQDQLMSDPIQTEIDNMSNKEKAAAVVQDNYYRLYYPQTGATENDSCILWDTLNDFWLRDSETYIDKPFTDEEDNLIEGSSRVGAIYRAEQAYSDLGKPIPFIYHTKIFGDGLRKLQLRRFVPSIRLQSQPYSLNIYIDIDQRNTNVLSYTLDASASGELWGGGETWGGGATWGSNNVGVPYTFRGTEAFWHQIRFEQTGVDTPVEILSYVLQIRVRRTE